MPLQFIKGPPGSGKTTHCLSEIEAHLPGSEPLYYLVPEQFSLQSERLVLQRRTANIRVQVLSFNRLAYRLFSALGGPPGRMVDDLSKAMLLRKILLENADVLVYYKSAHDKPGFVDSLAHTLSELNHYRVTAGDLLLRVDSSDLTDATADEAGTTDIPTDPTNATIMPTDHTLDAKLTDLSLILIKYRETITGNYLLTDDMLELLNTRLSAHEGAVPLLDGARIYVDGFSGFTPQERQILLHLVRRAVHVGLTLTTRDTPTHTDLLCEAPRITQDKLTHEAKQAGLTVLPALYFNENHRQADNPALAFFMENYIPNARNVQPFGETSPLANVHPDVKERGVPPNILQPNTKTREFTPITLHPAANPYASVLTAAALIRDWTQAHGWRYTDIAIVCGDRTVYEKILRPAFDRLGIPLFVDTEISILPHPLTELIRAVFGIVTYNFSYESVFRFLKTGLTGIPQDEVDILENYVLAHGIHGFRWQYPMRNETAERARAQFMQTVKYFPRANYKMTVTQFSQAVFALLDALHIPTTLARLFDKCMAKGDTDTARTHKQIWPKICEIFDKLVEILGTARIDTQDFAALLDAGLSNASLGRIPPTLDQVVLGDITRSRYPAIKAMIVLGANEGMLPPLPAGPGLFTDDERDRLRNTGLELAADLTTRLNEQYYALWCALSQPTEALAFIQTESDSSGKPLRPSPVLRTVRTLFPAITLTAVPLPDEFIPLENLMTGATAYYFPPAHGATARALSPTSNTIADDFSPASDTLTDNFSPASDSSAYTLSPVSVNYLFGPVIYTSASRLEAYARCPFAYYLTYLLRAKPRKLHEILPTDLGNLFHASVALFAARHGWQRRTKKEIDTLITPLIAELTAAETQTAYQASARNRHILEKARRVCTASIWALTEHIQTDPYRPAFSETDLPPTPPTPLENGRAVALSGRIDRVDLLPEGGHTYVKIIDYKSGAARFNPNDVQNGTRLQLPLYLRAMLNHPEIPNAKPGGLYYFPIDDPLIQTNTPLTEPAREAALLKAFKPSGIEPTDELLQTAENTMRTLTTRLTDGFIPATPCPVGGKSPCEYCNYSAVCKYEI